MINYPSGCLCGGVRYAEKDAPICVVQSYRKSCRVPCEASLVTLAGCPSDKPHILVTLLNAAESLTLATHAFLAEHLSWLEWGDALMNYKTTTALPRKDN